MFMSSLWKFMQKPQRNSPLISTSSPHVFDYCCDTLLLLLLRLSLMDYFVVRKYSNVICMIHFKYIQHEMLISSTCNFPLIFRWLPTCVYGSWCWIIFVKTECNPLFSSLELFLCNLYDSF